MLKTPLEKLAFRLLTLYGLTIIIGRFSHGIVLALVVCLGCYWAIKRQTAWALAAYMGLGFSMFVNPVLLPRLGVVSIVVRLGFFALGGLIVMTSLQFRARRTLPLGTIFVYLVCAAVSSIGGWAPSVSYMKIVFFSTFVLSIIFGARGLSGRPDEILRFRASILALALLLVLGSLAVLPFPSIAYSTSLRYQMAEFGAEVAGEIFKEQVASGAEFNRLFGGITNHSQALSPVLAVLWAWTICDMLFVERRFGWLHLTVVTLAVPMLYMTHSRLALLLMVATGTLVTFYLLNVIRVPRHVKSRAWSAMVFGIVALGALALLSESRSQGMSKWLRKTQDVRGDDRSIGEAVTESRMDTVEMLMDDYHRNPFLGTGFQVSPFIRDMARHSNGLILSAPIEKGVLPLMILSETGIIGSFAFLVFLICFYWGCSRKRLRTTATLFTILLMSNMGEATFFSPGNTGGVTWIICVLGGYVIDIAVLDGSVGMRRERWIK